MSFDAWQRRDGAWMITHSDCDGAAESCARYGCLWDVNAADVPSLLTRKRREHEKEHGTNG